MHVPDHRGARNGVFWREILLQELVRVEEECCHFNGAVRPAPLGAVAIPVQLDPVAFGVVEVERLAHEVVGAAGEAARMQVCHREDRRGESGLGVEQDRGVEQARLAGTGVAQGRRMLKDDDWRAAAAKSDGAVRFIQYLERDRISVIGRHGVEVGDEKRDGSHRGVGGETVRRGHVVVNPRRRTFLPRPSGGG